MSASLARRGLVLLGSMLVVAWSLAPIAWMAIGSITPELRPEAGKPWMSARGIEYFPSAPTLQNYRDLFENVRFGTYFLNSALVATGTMVIALCVASLGAYGFVRFHFAGRKPLLVATLMAYMIPSVVLMVPLMVILRSYGLMNTRVGLILAEATNTAPFVLLLMTNYFASLPRELEEAAQVDGCGRLGALVRIVLPLSVPGLVAGGLFAFIATWTTSSSPSFSAPAMPPRRCPSSCASSRSANPRSGA